MPVRFTALALLPALLLFPLLVPAPAMAQSNACPDFPGTVVRIHPVFNSPRYNFQQSLAQLRQIAETQSAAIFHRDQPVGLALGEMSVTMSMQANAVLLSDKSGVCAKPAALMVDVGFQNSTIYVARELQRRTCAHNEVLAHEEHHVEIDRQLLKEYTPIIQRYLETSLYELGTVKADDAGAAEAKMQAFISRQLAKVAEKMNAERSRRQAAHDSPQEYQRLAAVCDGEVTTTVSLNSPAAEREYKRNTSRGGTFHRPGVSSYRDGATKAPVSSAAGQRRWETQRQQVAPSSRQKASEFKGEVAGE